MRILIVVAVALVVYFFLRKRGTGTSASLGESSSAVDRWIKEALPNELARHLAQRGLDREQVARALGGDPDPAVVSTLEEHVRSIELEYARDPHGPEVDVCARIRFGDGEETVRTRLAWADVPAAVRDDFERKATSRVFRAWSFPWVRAQ